MLKLTSVIAIFLASVVLIHRHCSVCLAVSQTVFQGICQGLYYLFGACGTSVRVSVSESVRASVRTSVRASLGVSIVATVGVSVETSVSASVIASVGVSVEPSVRTFINLNCIMCRIILSS